MTKAGRAGARKTKEVRARDHRGKTTRQNREGQAAHLGRGWCILFPHSEGEKSIHHPHPGLTKTQPSPSLSPGLSFLHPSPPRSHFALRLATCGQHNSACPATVIHVTCSGNPKTIINKRISRSDTSTICSVNNWNDGYGDRISHE